jgi:hypothetical protein
MILNTLKLILNSKNKGCLSYPPVSSTGQTYDISKQVATYLNIKRGNKEEEKSSK